MEGTANTRNTTISSITTTPTTTTTKTTRRRKDYSYQQHPQYQQDKRFGEKYENLLLEEFNKNEYKDEPLKKFVYENSWFDFRNSKDCNELKTRRCFSHTYYTLWVGANKIRQAEKKKHGLKYRFFFIFKDKTMYWDFQPNPEGDNADIFYYFGKGGRKDRGCQEDCEVAYIFTENFKEYSKLNCSADC